MMLFGCQSAPLTADRPEPGLQGQSLPDEGGVLPTPYSVGVNVVGHSSVWNRASNVQLSWIDHCAYISSSGVAIAGIGASNAETAGLAVIDVSNPRAPRQVRLLRERGALNASETMHAVEAPDRRVIAAGDYAGGNPNFGPDAPPVIDIYDAADCENPRLMAEFIWPENVHTVRVSANGRRVYGTNLDPFSGRGGIHVLDITDMAHPRYLGKFSATRPDGSSFEFAPHEISISADERRIYAGVIGTRGGDLNRHITTPDGVPSLERFGPDAGGIYIFDNGDIAEGRADPKLRLISAVEGGGWHSVMQANMGGAPYLVGAGELAACPGSWPRISNIADETHPRIIGEFRLAMNHAENCPPREGIEAQSGGILGRPGTAAAHFNDVDSADHTRLGLFNFMYAGLRIVDLRDPANPTEIAYFKPGDPCTGHVRYVQQTGQIWLTCAASGFWVLELNEQTRARLH